MILTPEQMKAWIDETWTEAQKVAWAKENADRIVRAYENGYKAGAEREREECAQIVEQYCGAWNDQGYALAQAIRARGEK